MAKKSNKLSEQLRAAILGADKTRYRIAKETGLTEAALSRFVNRVSGMSLASIDKVGECLGLQLVSHDAKAERKKGR